MDLWIVENNYGEDKEMQKRSIEELAEIIYFNFCQLQKNLNLCSSLQRTGTDD